MVAFNQKTCTIIRKIYQMYKILKNTFKTLEKSGKVGLVD